MKDYSQNTLERLTFIKKYTTKDDKIIIEFADGDTYELDYTEETEQNILKKMIEQVEIGKKSIESKTINSKSVYLYYIFISLSNILKENGKNFALWLTLLITSSLLFLSKIIRSIKMKIIKTDINKSELLIENEELFNKDIPNECKFLSVSNKTLKHIENMPKVKEIPTNTNVPTQKETDRPRFDINSIDGISLKDLKIIKENIERYLPLELQENTINPEEVRLINTPKKVRY